MNRCAVKARAGTMKDFPRALWRSGLQSSPGLPRAIFREELYYKNTFNCLILLVIANKLNI